MEKVVIPLQQLIQTPKQLEHLVQKTCSLTDICLDNIVQCMNLQCSNWGGGRGFCVFFFILENLKNIFYKPLRHFW